jgi:hypothetical protein
VASISQPFRRLRDFQRVTLAPGETKTVSFALDTSDVGFSTFNLGARRCALLVGRRVRIGAVRHPPVIVA